jgi:hypothetical protein
MRVPYTVVGGSRWDRIQKYPYRITLLVIARGDRLFRTQLLRQLEGLDIGEIVWVEGPEVSHDMDLCKEFPDVRFLLLRDAVSRGAMINIGISESRAPYVLCLWSDMRVGDISPSILDAVQAIQAACILPVIKDQNGHVVPTYQSPLMRKGKLSLHFRPPSREGESVLFPFDYCGIYDKERFSRVGGFDPEIGTPYWQKLDFGFRCHLWGEKISGTLKCTLLSAGYDSAEDATPDDAYKLFYLKNIAVRFRREIGILPLGRIFEYIIRSGSDPFSAAKEFGRAREWIRINRSRFRRDPREMIDKWGAA